MQLFTPRLRLTPLEPDDAVAMFSLLSDPAIYRHLDLDPPPTAVHLRSVYARQAAGRSMDGKERWFNWIVRDSTDQPLGYVQATVLENAAAFVGYVFASRHWGHGYASESLCAMVRYLHHTCGVQSLLATVEALNQPSINLLVRMGFAEAPAAFAAASTLRPTERLYWRALQQVTVAP